MGYRPFSILTSRTARLVFLALTILLGMGCVSQALAGPIPANKPAAYPAWWFERDVVKRLDSNNASPVWSSSYPTADDYAVANTGQLKLIATQAYAELQARLPASVWSTPNGQALSTLVTSWNPAQGDAYTIINQGQLKAVSLRFYDVLKDVGYTSTYPWENATTAPDNYAAANLGQLKQIFSFTIPTLPVPLTGLIATPGNAQVTLSWNVNASATTYKVQRSTTSGSGYADFPGNVVTAPAVTLTNTGLSNGTTYCYVVKAGNAGVYSANSNQAIATPLAPPPVPTNLTAVARLNQVALTWNSVAGASSYKVQRSTTSGSGYADFGGNIVNAPTLTLTDIGINNGTTYYYVVSALNLGGGSANSAQVIVAPLSPPVLTATPGDNRVVLNWTATAGATAYRLQRSITSGSGYEDVVEYTVNSPTVTLEDWRVTNGVTYYYVISCISSNRSSGNSQEVAVQPVSPPAVPSGLTATAGNSQVTLSWTAMPGVVSYKVQRSTTSGSGYADFTGNTVSGGTNTLTNTGLNNGTTYYYVVNASNAGGSSYPSDQVNSTPVAPVTPPTTPTGFNAIAGNGQVTLNWNSVAGATSYRLLRSTTSGSGYADFGANTVTAPTLTLTDLGVNNGTTYYYVVSAVNGGGSSSNSAQVTATPLVPLPLAPLGLTTTSGNAQVILNWTAVSGATSYKVQRSTTSGSGYVDFTGNTVSGSVLSLTNAGLVNGTTYYYIVSASNSRGVSSNSGEAFATPASITSIQVYGGYDFSMALGSDGVLWAWGNNNYGQLGDGGTLISWYPKAVMSGVKSVAVGRYHAVVVKNGTVWTWGSNSYGQLGNNTTNGAANAPAEVSGITGVVVAVAAGDNLSLALTEGGEVWAWGANGSKQLGDGTTTPRLTPVRVKINSTTVLTGISKVVAGGSSVMALKTDGSLWGWGVNSYGQTGIGSGSPSYASQSGVINNLVAIAEGGDHGLGIKANGTVWAWGLNSSGQLGVGSSAANPSYTPLQVGGLSDAVGISAGITNSMVVLADGTIKTWGNNNNGQVGPGSSVLPSAPQPYQYTPVAVTESINGQNLNLNGIGVAVGASHSLAVLANGTIRGWGNNNMGQLGNGSNVVSQTPVVVSGLTYGAKVSRPTFSVEGGSYLGSQTVAISCATSGASIYYTLDGSEPTTGSTNVPSGSSVTISTTKLLRAKAFKSGVSDSDIKSGLYQIGAQVYAGHDFSMALGSDGVLWAWGNNTYGQLGDGGTLMSWYPKTVMSEVKSVALGQFHGVAVKNNGTVWTWGFNFYGQLGNNSTSGNSANAPAQVRGLTGVVAVAAGDNFSLALKEDGTVWAWGINSTKQLGDGSTANQKTTPVQVLINSTTGLTGISQVVAGGLSVMALKADGSLWGWGYSSYGQTGFGSVSETPLYASPSGLINNLVAISEGGEHGLGIKADGTVWAWGYNANGKMGVGSSIGSSAAPLQVGGASTPLSNAIGIWAGKNHSMAVLVGGTIKTWGSNNSGQIGNGTANGTNIYTPVTVTERINEQNLNLNGTGVAAGASHSVAVLADGTLRGWGSNYNGQLGNGSNVYSSSPSVVSGLTYGAKVSRPTFSVEGGSYLGSQTVAISCATSGASIYYTLDGSEPTTGSTGIVSGGSVTLSATKLLIAKAFKSGVSDSDTKSGLYQIGTRAFPSSDHSLVVRADGKLWAWGRNDYGQVGDGSVVNRKEPWPVVESVRQAAGGAYHTIIVKSDNTVWTWGLNNLGQLGLGSNLQRITPAQVTSLSGVVSVAAGDFFSVALKSDGTVWAWGANDDGQLGNGNFYRSNIPVQVYEKSGTQMTGVYAIAARGNSVLALKKDGSLWGWGEDGGGLVNAYQSTSLAVQSGIIRDFVKISLGDAHGLGIKADGRIWSWGANYSGQLARGGTQDPAQVAVNERILDVSAGYSYSLALLDTYLANASGLNGYRQLGNDTTDEQSVFGLVSDSQNSTSIAANQYHSIVVKADGHIMTFGNNSYGQLGNGTKTPSLTSVSFTLDNDNDDLADWWEIKYGFDISKSDQDINGTMDSLDDWDFDGVNNITEFRVGTNPLLKDADSDGIDDGLEINNYHTDPLLVDTDGDEIPDGWETANGLNPFIKDANQDPDGDGLWNAREFFYSTLPQNLDSDGDGLSDNAEIAAGAFPLNPDSDGDTLSDGSEVNLYRTSPKKVDTDEDTLRDDAELNQYNSDPTLVDTDYDGLTDTEEVLTYFTLPRNRDTDGDGMPDGWEVQYGLLPKIDDSLFNPDNDFLSNIEEYRNNTNPFVRNPVIGPAGRDSDTDGIDDNKEYNDYFTDWLSSNLWNFSVLTAINPSSGRVISGDWRQDNGSLMLIGRNGGMEYDCQLATAGIFRLEVAGLGQYSGGTTAEFNLWIYVDNKLVDFGKLKSVGGSVGKAEFVLPYLHAGSHVLRIETRNGFNNPWLQLDTVKISKLLGPDANGDGIADVLENRLNQLNEVTISPATSPTSPACVEGKTRYLSAMSISGGIIPQLGLTDAWYANIPLSPTAATLVQFSFENGIRQASRQIEWVSTNVLSANNLTIRKGDSLKLMAAPSGVTTGQCNIQLNAGTTYSATPTNPVVHQFTSAGSFTITGTHVGATTTTRSIVITVLEATFPSKMPHGVLNQRRSWNCAGIPTAIVMSGDERIGFTSSNYSGGKSLSFVMDAPLKRTILARVSAGGPILARSDVAGVEFHNWRDLGIAVGERYTDGSTSVEMGVAFVSAPDDLELDDLRIRIHSWKSGITFDDGSIDREWTSQDADADGLIKIHFLAAPGVAPAPCHRYGLFDGSEGVN